MEFGRTILRVSICVWCLAVSAAAQGKTKFDPTRDLTGFEAIRASEDKDLYPIDVYEEMLGLELDSKALTETQAKWKAESDAVRQHLAEVISNPTVGARWLVDTRMSKHPFFSKIKFTVDTSIPTLLVYVQTPSFDDPAYPASVVRLFGPFLTKLVSVFDERVVKSLGVTRRADRPLTPLVILASPGDLQNYLRLGHPADGFTSNAMFDARLGIVLTAINSFDKPKATTALLHPVLREVFLALLRAHVAAPLKDVPSMWLREGLASTFSFPRGAQVDALDKPQPRIEDLRCLVENCHNPKARNTLIMPVSALASFTSWEGVWAKAYGLNASASNSGAKLSASFGAQSALWAYFLTLGREGKYKDRFDKYQKLAFTGQSGADSLSFAFANMTLPDLDRDFWAWVYDEHARLAPETAIDKADLVGLFDPIPKEGVVDEIVARAKQSLTPAVVEPPFAPASLAIGEHDVASRHGLALQSARSGDLEGARTALEAIAKSNPPAPDADRIARDLVRVSAAIALRDGFLSSLIARNARLALEINGKKVNAPVSKVENGQIVFGDNSFGAKTLPLSALDPLDVARQTDKREYQGSAPTWTRAWLFLLAGDAKWEKMLKADSTEARDVQDDGSIWYRDRLQTGIAASLIEKLAQLPLPKSRAEAEPILAMIRELLKTHAEASCVLLKKPALQKFATSALEASSSAADGSEFVRGKFTKASDGVVTLVYEFEAAAEAYDFTQDTGHLAEWRKSFASGSLPEEGSAVVVKGGSLLMRGNAFWRLPIGFEAPITMSAEFTIPDEEGKLTRAPTIAFQLCDDGKDSFVHVDCLGNLNVVDTSTGAAGHASSPFRMFYPGRSYRLDVVHDGVNVSSTLDGKEATKGEVGKLQSGGVEVLAISASILRLNRLEITGKLDALSLSAARAAWVKKSLADMGFTSAK